MRGTNEYAEQSEQNELPHGEYSYRRTFTTALINFTVARGADAAGLHIARLAYVMCFTLGTRAHVI